MRYSFTLASLGLISSALAITITTPSSDTEWDFSTPKTIKFTSDSSDPEYISIILRNEDGSFQTKLADNVKTSEGEYTTQPNPSISNGDDYEIQIIDSSGQLAVSPVFTVEKGASNDGTSTAASSKATITTASLASSSNSTSTTATAAAQQSVGAAASTAGTTKGALALLGAVVALFYA
ncbi:GPI anchored serine-threonine rich family protein [Aspergillus brunneoviolaceus CBS 621.78]|uniref:Uncharacterized protein n=2 Tax=Aspergillus brunneoviolaceus CBS 621.78 TaxID=1450534 RepID=A0ACD1GJZ9_9EURO|nr:hypothetical protein BO95DRAFT_439202 [Aspergillus brunneoviolaceus CBS 621.78]XP_025446111.1 hypothetical protein BO95DRAFT_439214 [Aspergillus brunneoviolaceus CBS 621.78]RAH49565.1 hypothetical protein BO95DRAFT_439202 [Aspergillus brunneoviolaceus CBS 621.78]RAH49590.1 hypothetical protein BO95DRAFT_439214 [Aspergillus brunneoviolaceus CBS 621.78]